MVKLHWHYKLLIFTARYNRNQNQYRVSKNVKGERQGMCAKAETQVLTGDIFVTSEMRCHCSNPDRLIKNNFITIIILLYFYSITKNVTLQFITGYLYSLFKILPHC